MSGDREPVDSMTALAAVWLALVLFLVAALVLAGLARTVWLVIS